MIIDPEKRKLLRRMRSDMLRIQKSEYVKSDAEFLKAARQFVRRIPTRNEDLLRMGIHAPSAMWFDVYYDEMSNDFRQLIDWSDRLFQEWIKVTNIKREETEENADMKEVTNIIEIKEEVRQSQEDKAKKKQMALDFRGGARPGAGRKRIGTTRTIKLTLPDEDWNILLYNGATYSEAIRNIIDDWRGNPMRDEKGNKVRNVESR